MTTRVVFDEKSVKSMLYALEQLPRRVAIKHLRIGLNAWGGVVKGVAQQNVKEDTGILKKSIGVKVVIPDASRNVAHHGKPARVMVGPQRRKGRIVRMKGGGFKSYGKANTALKRNRVTAGIINTGSARRREELAVDLTKQSYGGVYRNPTRYAHLVEGGTTHSRAYPFIEPAQQAGESAGMDKLVSKIKQGLEQEAAALAKR